jgi:NADH-quinone oxidoreductase subunit G
VRFGQEIAGIMELGMIGRGEHSEIITFVGKTVDSELSGNVIDLCPVGALTSKPFRYSARTWELTRKPSVSPHCGLGSNLTVQVKQNRVMRVLPREIRTPIAAGLAAVVVAALLERVIAPAFDQMNIERDWL